MIPGTAVGMSAVGMPPTSIFPIEMPIDVTEPGLEFALPDRLFHHALPERLFHFQLVDDDD